MNVPRGKPVPQVNPEHLRHALKPIYVWADAGDCDEESETIGSTDLHELLEGFVQRFEVDTATATAIFKRAIALSAFCADAELPERLFEDGFPGRELCTAAAYLAVVDVPGETEQELSHTFDRTEMDAALRVARH